MTDNPLKKPDWIRGKISIKDDFKEMRSSLHELRLETVCTHAACPNRGECWEKGHVTFIIIKTARKFQIVRKRKSVFHL